MRATAPRSLVHPLLGVLLLLLTFYGLVATARADPAIEGVWSFNGGRIAIQEQSPGAFEGTVVSPTTFSLCAHSEGEEIWTHISQQPDGSFWGLHQWFFETSECVRNPALGQTAWRVLQKAQGRYLRACFSEPGSNLQPTIAPSGAPANATFGCVDSSLVSQVPDVSARTIPRYIHFPSNKRCLAGHKLRIRISDPENDPIMQVAVTARNGKAKVTAKLRRTKAGFLAVLPLAQLRGTIKVRVRISTVLGERVTAKRTYHRCGGGR